MDQDKLRRFTAVLYAVARAETAEEYAAMRNACYAATEQPGDSLERTIFDDLCHVFEPAQKLSPQQLAEHNKAKAAADELAQKLNRQALNIFAGSEQESPMDPADFRLAMGEF